MKNGLCEKFLKFRPEIRSDENSGEQARSGKDLAGSAI